MDTQTEEQIIPPLQNTSSGVRTSRSPAPSVAHAASLKYSARNSAPEVQPGTTRKPISPSLPLQTASIKSTSDMQPPPAKRQRLHNYDRRPRLSICPSVSPDPDLVEDRDRNDNTLKGKFEAIFEKYGRDFSEIGDEINVMTGEVVVDHGHILSMQDEKDPGSPSRAKSRVSREPTDFQTMTPMRHGERSLTVGALDVIASIEAMARRAITGQTPYGDDQEKEDDDKYATGEAPPCRSGSVSSDSLLGSVRDDFRDDWARQRSGSPDSLLGYEEQDSSIESFYEEHTLLPPLPFSATGSKDSPIVLTSGPIPAPAPDFEVLTARQESSHGSASFSPPSHSAPVFVKSNGQKRVVLKKINVSKAYEELQRQASSTPAITSSHTLASAAAKRKDKTTGPLARLQPSSAKVEPIGRLQEVAPKPTATRDVKFVLKRLPVPRPSSEPLGMDYESDDPLQ